jgi:hypothetical protein
MPTICMTLLAFLEANEGHCERVEELAQTMLAAGDASPVTFRLLSEAVYGRSHDPALLHSVLERGWHSAQPPVPAMVQAEQKVAEAILAGDFDRALSTASALEPLYGSVDTAADYSPAADGTIELESELGMKSEALARTKRFAADEAALNVDALLDVSVDIDRHLRELGAISDDEFHARRDAWVSSRGPKLANRYGAFTFVWIPAYAFPVRTRGEAEDAIARMSEYLPMTDPINRSGFRDEAIGRVYLTAERPADALPFLERATRSCSAVLGVFSYARALYELGAARAALGRTREACEPLRRLAQMWGHDERSVTGAKAKRLMSTLGCEKAAQ